ncbi:MAG: SagB/ThcOx family dehydrogenase [Candidatus Heimdallarchaeota archaeon]|nr:SagB/ThcOx family dehydrogenase [Candidatus Heimdallarchaeota archaeon]MCK4954330.1 SagB/ThcOx family dehydrogenase [Candidatus Heimdallarchaeota archaeon]
MSFDRDIILKHRRILRVFDDDIEEFPEGFQTDQQKKLPNPPLQKPYPEDAKLIDLVPIKEVSCGKEYPLFDALRDRKSRRVFSDELMSLEELSFLLWSTQGVHKEDKHHGASLKKPVPSGGSRHPYETYLIVNKVEGLDSGIYRYLGMEHKLLFLKPIEEVDREDLEKLTSQSFIIKGNVIFVWVTIPYRMEWRYSIPSSKVIAIEAGHICQNLYLACEALGLGTCAIAAYNQEFADKILGLDGEDEFTVYLSPVGKI